MHHGLFFPSAGRPGPELLANEGLAEDQDGAHYVSILLRDVPGLPEQIGTLVYWPTPRQPTWPHSVDLVDWQPAAVWGERPSGRYWVGFRREDPPRESELRRSYQQPGTFVSLGDESEWLIPSRELLPCDCLLREDGQWVLALQRRFRAFHAEAIRTQRRIAGGEELSILDLIEFAIAALRINYRITPDVVSRRGLLNTENLRAAVNACLLGQTEVPR